MSAPAISAALGDEPRLAWFDAIRRPAVLSESQREELKALEARYSELVELDPADAVARNNRGWARQMLGRDELAASDFAAAHHLAPELEAARRNLATLLVQLGRGDETFRLWHEELSAGEAGRSWVSNIVSDAMAREELALAGEYARILAALRHGSEWYPGGDLAASLPLPVGAPPAQLTIPKLEHDIEQFEFLRARGVLGEEFAAIADEYRAVIETLQPRGRDGRMPLDPVAHRSIADVYGRIVHVRSTPRAEHALSDR